MAGENSGGEPQEQTQGETETEITPELVYQFGKAESVYDQYSRTFGKMREAAAKYSPFFTLSCSIQYTELGDELYHLLHDDDHDNDSGQAPG